MSVSVSVEGGAAHKLLRLCVWFLKIHLGCWLVWFVCWLRVVHHPPTHLVVYPLLGDQQQLGARVRQNVLALLEALLLVHGHVHRPYDLFYLGGGELCRGSLARFFVVAIDRHTPTQNLKFLKNACTYRGRMWHRRSRPAQTNRQTYIHMRIRNTRPRPRALRSKNATPHPYRSPTEGEGGVGGDRPLDAVGGNDRHLVPFANTGLLEGDAGAVHLAGVGCGLGEGIGVVGIEF